MNVTIVETETATVAGKPVTALPVRLVDGASTNSAGQPVAALAVTEAAGGAPVIVVADVVVETADGRQVDSIPVTGLE